MLSYLHAAPRRRRAGRLRPVRRRARDRPRPAGSSPPSGSALVVVIPGSKQFHHPGCPLVRKAGSKVKVMKQAEAERRGLTPHDCGDPGNPQRDAAAAANASTVLRAGERQAVSRVRLQALEGGRRRRSTRREGGAGSLAVPRLQAAHPPACEVGFAHAVSKVRKRSAVPGWVSGSRCVPRARFLWFQVPGSAFAPARNQPGTWNPEPGTRELRNQERTRNLEPNLDLQPGNTELHGSPIRDISWY